jgi:hypothetical protein
MGLSSEMKNLSEEILNSFKLRLKENEDLVNDVQKTLDGFHKDHMEMAAVLNARAADLRTGLATGEKERLATFDNLMDGIHNTITSLKGEVAAIQTSTVSMVNEFAADRSLMAAEGKADRMQNESTRMKEFDALMKNINDEIKGINEEVFNIIKDTNDMLTRFDMEHHEMSAELRAELGKNLTDRVNYTRSMLKGFQKRLAEISKENQQMAQNLRKGLKQGEDSRLKDYNSIMKGIRGEVMNIQKSTSGMIDHLSKDRDLAAADWKKMQDTIAQLRKTGITKPAKKAEKKNEILNVPTPEIIVDEQILAISPELAAEPEEKVISMSFEEKVLAFINKHPGGVKISEMEGPLGETRMKLGYTAKGLLNAGKVQKLDNNYFPIK